MTDILIGDGERRYIIGGAEQNVRNDGRRRDERRPTELQVGMLAQATGSARARIGNTDVIVAVKAEIGSPCADCPDAGTLAFHVECSPLASPAFRGRGGEELGSEIARALERAFHVPPAGTAPADSVPALDLSSLNIVSGKTCWILYIDALVLDLDGAALDAVSIGIKAALWDTRIPRVNVVQAPDSGDEPEFEIDDDPEAAVRLDVSHVPLIQTVSRLGTAAVVDATAIEEESSSAAVQVAVDASRTLRGATKRHEEALEPITLLVWFCCAGNKIHVNVV